jgi:hypothetical protein
MPQKISWILLFFFTSVNAQNIKSIQLRPLQENNYTAIVPLGTVLELSFDDLEADSKDYQYKIEHMTSDWESSRLFPSQYIDGFDQNTIINVRNSFNTLQNYTHYSVKIPNINTVITKSGNYLLSVLDEYDEVVFTRRFVLYEKTTTIGVSVIRSRNTKTINQQQTVQFSVNHPTLQINNPNQEIKVVLLKNDNWNEKITGLQPQFYKQHQLIYRYTNKTNFWGGNEYLNFDNKIIRNKSVQINRVEKKDVYHHYLYPFKVDSTRKYSYNPDINGQFVIRSLEGDDVNTEGDYAMMHFSLEVDSPIKEKKVYVYGAFNGFKLLPENQMIFDDKDSMYKAKFLLKQGFYNYTFATVNTTGKLDLSELNGTFYQTENQYTVLLYYKRIGDFYERVIGVGTGFFNQNR